MLSCKNRFSQHFPLVSPSRWWPRILLLALGVCLASSFLAACASPIHLPFSIGSDVPTNLTPLTPAAPLPLAQLKWCSGTSPTEVQPGFAVLLPPTLSPDYCLSQATASGQTFRLTYRHKYYYNNLYLSETMQDSTLAQQGIVCGTELVGIFSPMPSEPYPHNCSENKGALHISIAAPEAQQDIMAQLLTLQPNVAFLPA